ncbi:hypothetical protein MACK_003732 [Theileria orientalis]|uniref:Uncharacterized protein n=1 Tax=Theileria orientalis TaxID=68886 RepID=A0A976SIX9_THEOR|nr:hypothetical protein MACK_003732 [Theileria orientalis]
MYKVVTLEYFWTQSARDLLRWMASSTLLVVFRCSCWFSFVVYTWCYNSLVMLLLLKPGFHSTH